MQSEKWVQLTLSHTSKAIALVHDFIFRLLATLCPEKQVKDQLWNSLLVDRLGETYCKAMEHTQFLLNVERGGNPSTFIHYFNTTLQQKRAKRISKPLKERAVRCDGHHELHISTSDIEKCVTNKNNGQQVCEDILDTVTSYYKVSRKRFVDVVCQQVVSPYLLHGQQSPLMIFSPDLIMGLDSEQLEMIAGEDEESKQQRQSLEREIQSLDVALKVLRT